MMYKKDINLRSPMRVFERSINGGLGRGNLGLVMSRAGVGKSAFLVGVALDDLMRDKRVLHVSTRDPAEKVRQYYEEIFNDLADSTDMQNRAEIHREMERNRMIHTFHDDNFNLDRVRTVLDYMSEHMDFVPSLLIMDGYPDWDRTTSQDIHDLKDMAVDLNCETWLRCRTHREGEPEDERGVPVKITEFEDYLSVILKLDPAADHVRLQLIKDHDSTEVADLHIELEPSTLLLRWQ